MDIRYLLRVMVERDASDIYLTVDLPPIYRIQGITHPIGDTASTNEQLEKLANDIMREKQRKESEEKREMNLAWYYPELGRFRANIFANRGTVGFVIRQIKLESLPTT